MLVKFILNIFMWIARNCLKNNVVPDIGCLLNRLACFGWSPFVLAFALEDPDFPPLDLHPQINALWFRPEPAA